MRRKALFGLLILIAHVIAGCSQYHTRLFFLTDSDRQKCVQEFCVFPRIVVFKDVFGSYPEKDNGYWTSLKVYDVSAREYDVKPPAADPRAREEQGTEFLHRTLDRFYVDSVALNFLPMEERFVVPADSSKYTPRDIDFLSFNFGKVEIPRYVDSIQAVFYYHVRPLDQEQVRQDSLSFRLRKIERHHRSPFTDIEGVEDLPEDEDLSKDLRGN